MGEVVQGGFAADRDLRMPWNPITDREIAFYCSRLGLDDLYLTPDIVGSPDSQIWYQVTSKSDTSKRVYPVAPDEIVPTSSKEAKIAQETKDGLFQINLATIAQIKDLLINKFIPSYNWESDEQKAEQLSKAKRPRDGYFRDIEQERNQGSFENKEDFTTRMNAKQEGFPWGDLANFLDYKIPVS